MEGMLEVQEEKELRKLGALPEEEEVEELLGALQAEMAAVAAVVEEGMLEAAKVAEEVVGVEDTLEVEQEEVVVEGVDILEVVQEVPVEDIWEAL